MFKFKKNGNRYRWESNSTVIEYSKPRIQGHNSYTLLEDENDIMYFYYAIKIYRKDEEEKLYCERKGYAFDFPCILELKGMIETLIAMRPNDEWQTVRFVDGSIAKKYILDTGGFGQDDYCSIQKDVCERREYYSLFFGFPIENGIGDIYGITIKHLSEEDMRELLECIKAFIEYAIKSENKLISRELSLSSRDKEIRDGKLYTYKTEKNFVDKTRIDDIYIADDILSMCYIKKDDEVISFGHRGAYIKEINKDSIIIQTHDSEINVGLKDILYISADISEDILYWDVEKIKEHFKELLSDNEKHYFINHSLDEVESMYEDALIGRFWMCRTEHPYHDNEIKNVEKAHLVAKSIISKIRDELI